MKTSKEKFVHSVFESIAPKYDKMNDLLSFRRHKAWRRFALKKMNIQPGMSALDVCCGTCDWTISMAQLSQGGKIVGLDFSQNMLDYGKNKIQNLEVDKFIELVNGNAMNLPYEDNTFDAATIGFALRNVPDVGQVLKEMTRVVKPGGQVVSLELSKPTWPLFRQLYYLYFNQILPWVGRLAADRYEQYRWLPESLIHFPDYKQLAVIFEQTGLEKVQAYPLTGGIAALHIGYKPEPKS
jgi:demethylmenaquinone methyltransferase/2-methoxy-6-polyprenyl-1,4-benzoquinol methylase